MLGERPGGGGSEEQDEKEGEPAKRGGKGRKKIWSRMDVRFDHENECALIIKAQQERLERIDQEGARMRERE
jgi:hypothetical protein